MQPPMKFRDAITSRVKIMAKLDIAEKRLPQDGRIKIRFSDNGNSKEIDFRVSCLPTLFGEKIVMRLLDREKLMLDMTRLGFESESLRRFEAQIVKPWGMVLVTGPTGSGKTNTLYSSISKLNTIETNIMTVEDPVEFNLPGVNQVNVREQIGLNFAAALRSFLRQDPNIILVGEIRDFETAEIAVKAALTGHLVLSHAAHQRCAEHRQPADEHGHRAVSRGELGQPHLCTAPRPPALLRTARRPHPLPPQGFIDVGYSRRRRRRRSRPSGASGCEKCNNTGYKGRVGLYEVMEVTEELRELILVGASALELRRKAREEGMLTLRESGLCKVKDGMTSIEEVVRETVK